MGVVRRGRICNGWVGGWMDVLVGCVWGGWQFGWLGVGRLWLGVVSCVRALAAWLVWLARLVWCGLGVGLSLAWVWFGFGVLSSR